MSRKNAAPARAPEVSQLAPGRPADLLQSTAVEWTRSFFSQRSRVGAALEIAAALAVVSVLPLHHWSRSSFVVLSAAASFAMAHAAARFAIGERLPRWSLHVDVVLGNLFVSVVVVVSAKGHVELENLYLLVELFALLYLPLRSALAHLASAGVAYAAILGFVARSVEPPVVAWLAVFGTAAVLGASVVGLVSVLRLSAREDPLTGLANRRSWDERLEEELERSRRSGTPLSVVVVDLDEFKAVNDAHGHATGDHLLRVLATSWHEVARDGGAFLARLGGDEFALLAPGSDEKAARHLADRLGEALPEGVFASIAAATWDGEEHASDLLRRADRNMYRVKRCRRLRTGGGLTG